MDTGSNLKYFLAILFLGFYSLAFADLNQANEISKDLIVQKDKIFDPNQLSLDSIQVYEKNFDFDWNNFTTIEPNRKKIADIAAFITATKKEDYQNLNDEDLKAFSQLYLKLSTYYTHIAREPDLAIDAINLSNSLLKKKEVNPWALNNLAYAYEQKFAKLNQDADEQKARQYVDELSKINRHKKNKELAFAYCIQGNLHKDEKNFGLAERYLKMAIEIYDKLPNGRDDQYYRAKNNYASVLLNMNNQDEVALKLFIESKKYWQKKGDLDNNPYAARNLIALANAYIKERNDKAAQIELEKAIRIYKHFYGEKSELLKTPYELLSQTYQHLGKKKLAKAYARKVIACKRIGSFRIV